MATIYTVQRGDSLQSLASKFGVDYRNIMKANGLSLAVISIGQRLTIPDPALDFVTVDVQKVPVNDGLDFVTASSKKVAVNPVVPVYTGNEITITGQRPKWWEEWLKAPKVYYAAGALLLLGVVILSGDGKRK